MGAFLVYIFEAAVCLLLLYAVQKLLLAKEKWHKLNRALWLLTPPAALLLPLCIPLVKAWLFVGPGIPTDFAPAVFSQPAAEAMAVPVTGGSEHLAWVVKVLAILYFAGLACCLGILAFRYAALCRLLRMRSVLSPDQARLLEDCKQEIGLRGRVRLLVHDRELAPLSWMRFVVVGQEDLARNGREILLHELRHCQAAHSLDLMFAQLVCAALWFCPAAWLMKAALAQVHEYQADAAVLDAGTDARHYQLLLVRKAVGQRLYSMANGLNYSTLKSRIQMMTTQRTSKWALAKCLVVLPLSFVALTAFATPSVSGVLDRVAEQSLSADGQQDKKEKKNKKDKKAREGKEETQTHQPNVIVIGEKIPVEEGEAQKGEPLIMVDGKKIPYGDLAKISPDRIAHITVVKDSTVLVNFGQEAKYGVVLVELYPGNGTAKDSVNREEAKQQPSPKKKLKVSRNEVKVLKAEGVKMPVFSADGCTQFTQWVMQRVTYPESAPQPQGRIVLGFVVDVRGQVTKARVMQNTTGSEALGERVVRIVMSSPKWTPGQDAEGKPVEVKQALPLIFRPK